MVAQQLYEGIEIKGRGTVGLVSYIRTDSVRISDEAREAAREYIMESMGQEYYGGTVYTTRKRMFRTLTRPSDPATQIWSRTASRIR